MPPVLRFGSFIELRSTQRVLLAHGSPVPLGSPALNVLVALLARQGELVTKDELLNSAWPGLVVEEANVHAAVSQLPKVLGKAAISTVGGLCYRFALPLIADAPAAPEPALAPALPQPRTAFVGRQAELADADAQLQNTRLLTPAAMGGMGKTRLALQLARALQGRYANGVFFVDLQAPQDGSAVPGAVAHALALDTTGGSSGVNNASAAATTEALLRHLQQRQALLPNQGQRQALLPNQEQRQALLVLDNCEHLLPAVRALLTALLAQAPDVTVLATSRQALELAAARLKMLSLSLPQLHKLLAQRFELLSRSGPGGTTRQQALQDVLQWSHEHLAPAEQTLAQAVAVCASGFDLDTAVALAHQASADDVAAADAGAPSPVAVLDSQAQLADRAMIHVTHGGDTARYGLLETVREYLLAQLAQSSPMQAVRQRHAAHFHWLALQAEQVTAAAAAGSADAASWAARLDPERDNLLAALAFSQRPGSRPADQHRGLEMVAALKNFCFASGWLEQGLRAAVDALAQVPAQQPTLLTARVQRLAAQLCLFMSRLDEGAMHARLALAASTVLGDEASDAAALCFAGRVAVKSEDTASGEKLLQEGLRRARQVQALAVVGEALNALAVAQELVDVCASFALHDGHCKTAALLHGASATQRQALQLPLTAKQAARRASEAAAARAALGEAGYETAAAQGRQQQHGQTLAFVGSGLQQGPLPVGAAAAARAETVSRKGARTSGRKPIQSV